VSSGLSNRSRQARPAAALARVDKSSQVSASLDAHAWTI
jgi:hypothetical protein